MAEDIVLLVASSIEDQTEVGLKSEGAVHDRVELLTAVDNRKEQRTVYCFGASLVLLECTLPYVTLDTIPSSKVSNLRYLTLDSYLKFVQLVKSGTV